MSLTHTGCSKALKHLDSSVVFMPLMTNDRFGLKTTGVAFFIIRESAWISLCLRAFCAATHGFDVSDFILGGLQTSYLSVQ